MLINNENNEINNGLDNSPINPNIVSDGYAFKSNKSRKRKISKAKICFLFIIIFTAIYDISMPFMGEVKGQYVLYSILLNSLVILSVIGIIIIDYARRKRNIRLSESAATDKVNEVILDSEPALEQLFLEEFRDDANIDNTNSEKSAQQLETVALHQDSVKDAINENSTTKSVTDELKVYLEERGISASTTTLRIVISALFASHLIICQNADLQLLSEFTTHLCAYFGTNVYNDDIGISSQASDSSLEEGDLGNARTAVINRAISDATFEANRIHIALLRGAEFPQSEQILMPIASFSANPERKQEISQENENVFGATAIPLNLWFIVASSGHSRQGGMSQYFAENAIVIDVKLSRTAVSSEPSSIAYVSYQQFLQIGKNNEDDITISEEFYKKLDKLTEYVNTYAPYRIGNKQWRRIEKFMSSYLACESTEEEATDVLVATKLLPCIMTIIMANPTVDNSDFSYTLKKYFGDNNSILSMSTELRKEA